MTSMPFKSTFYTTILYHSRFNPHAIAVSFGDRNISYAQFVRDIERVTKRLHNKELPKTGRAIIHVGHPYLHWLLLLALGRIGMTSVTVYDIEKPGLLDLIQPDVVLTSAATNPSDMRFHQVNTDWLSAESDTLPAFVDQSHNYDDPFRMVLSSGTTGIPKKILLTHGQFQSRLKSTASGSGFSPTTRATSLVGFDTIAGLQVPMAAWFTGGRVILQMPDVSFYETVVKHDVTYAFMSPVQLEHAMKSLPQKAWPVQNLTISVGGSTLPGVVAEKALRRLAHSLVMLYGSTESGIVTRGHVGFSNDKVTIASYVVPEVDVQIVDEAGNTVPNGLTGEIRIRSESCVTGYLDSNRDAAGTEEVFRDGWFYPGDAGILSPAGMLTIVGRTKELMNFGGVKVSPNLIEEILRTCPGVKDIAAFAMDLSDSTDQPWVAVVRDENYHQDTLAARFKQRFPELPPLAFANIDAIPRNQMGKIQRDDLRKLVKQSLKQTISKSNMTQLH